MTIEEFFSKEIIIENDLLRICPLKKSHLNIIKTISFSNALGEFGARVKNNNDLLHYFEFCEASKANNTLYPFIILKKEDNKPVGITMFGNINFSHKRLESRMDLVGRKISRNRNKYYL